MAAKNTYDESKIKTLSSLEHIRLRTGMYIGRLGTGSHPDDGIYILIKAVLDNSIDVQSTMMKSFSFRWA